VRTAWPLLIIVGVAVTITTNEGPVRGQCPALRENPPARRARRDPADHHRARVRRGLHIHNGPVFGSIETGSAVYQIEGEPETVLKPGDVFYEPEGVRIARFDAQEDGVTFSSGTSCSPTA
jgi:hypothetical protein